MDIHETDRNFACLLPALGALESSAAAVRRNPFTPGPIAGFAREQIIANIPKHNKYGLRRGAVWTLRAYSGFCWLAKLCSAR